MSERVKRILLLVLLLPFVALADVAVVGTPNADVDDGVSYAPETGANRVVLWSMHSATGASVVANLTGATYDGDAMTADGGIVNLTVGVATLAVGLFRDSEAGLPGGPAVLNASWSTSEGAQDGAALTLSGVDQSESPRRQLDRLRHRYRPLRLSDSRCDRRRSGDGIGDLRYDHDHTIWVHRGRQ